MSIMTENYHQALLSLAQTALTALEKKVSCSSNLTTSAAQSHFLCSYLVQAQKQKLFSKLVAKDIDSWIRDGRSLGANAALPALLKRIVTQYQAAVPAEQVGVKLHELLNDCEQQSWVVITDKALTHKARTHASSRAKLKLSSQGNNSLIIDNQEFQSAQVDGKLTAPVTLYIRANEQLVAKLALEHGLLLSQGDKKASLIKHHKAYQLNPNNRQNALALLYNRELYN